MLLAKYVPENMLQLQERDGKYIKAEEAMKKQTTMYEGEKGSKKRKEGQEYDSIDKYPHVSKGSDLPPKATLRQRFGEYTRLNAPISQILMDIEKDKDVRWPKTLRIDLEKRDKNLYYRFHKDVGHTTKDCRHLKDEIEYLIHRGRLGRYVMDGDKNEEIKGYDNRRRNQNEQVG